MSFFSKYAFFFLAFIPLILLMYILKQKYEERQIGSTYLWSQVIKDLEVDTPWQKLRSNLLLLLQLLAITALTFAIADPFMYLKGKDYKNVIIVVDNSGSMNSSYKKTTALEEAKSQAKNQINSLSSGSKITVVACSKYPKVLVSGTIDKKEAIKKIEDVTAIDVSGDINDSISLVKSITKQYDSYTATFYTDRALDLKGLNGQVIGLNTDAANVSIDYMSHSMLKDGAKVMVRMTNRKGEATKRELCLYDEDKLITLKAVDLKAGETKTVYFDKVDAKGRYLKAEFTEKDGLSDDNVAYTVFRQSHTYKVLLVSEKNVFLEKAFKTIGNVDLYKATSIDQVKDKFDLYIFDGEVPKVLPAEGSVLLVNPNEGNSVVKVKGSVKGGEAKILPDLVTKNMVNTLFSVSEFKSMDIPAWGKSIMQIGQQSASFVGEDKGRKFAVIGFDLHKSDFPLTTQFPIFIHNLADYLMDSGLLNKTSYLCGDTVDISAMADGGAVNIETSYGTKESIPVKYPLKPFENTLKPGIYKVSQKGDKAEKSAIFAVNFPADYELKNAAAMKTEAGNISKSTSSSLSGINLRPYCIALVLILLLAEWLVYVKRR